MQPHDDCRRGGDLQLVADAHVRPEAAAGDDLVEMLGAQAEDAALVRDTHIGVEHAFAQLQARDAAGADVHYTCTRGEVSAVKWQPAQQRAQYSTRDVAGRSLVP